MPDGSRSFPATPDPALERVAELFREHFDFVARVLSRCGVPTADIDDAVQETFLVVHRKIGDFEGRASERTWLYAVAVRVASTLRRSAKREAARRDKAGEGVHAASDASPEAELARTEAARLLDQLLGELDQPKRVVFVLAELEGVQAKEIARILDLNVRTVHSRLRLARERFHSALGRHHAREEGALRRAAVRSAFRQPPRKRTPASRVQAAWAALAVRIGDGAQPMPFIWKGLAATATAKSASFALPFAATVGLGLAGLSVATWSTEDPAEVTVSSHAIDTPAPLDPPATPRGPSAKVVHAAPAAVAPPPAPPANPAATPATRVDHTPRHASKSGAAPAAGPRDAPAPPDTLAAETQLIERARKAVVAGKTNAALSLLDAHAAEFPEGVFAAERDASRVKALCVAGRNGAARAFVAGHDRASLRAILTAHCDQ